MRIRHATARRTSLLVALLAAITAVPSAASAFWTAGDVGAGSATTGTLDAPTDVRAGVTGRGVTITWTPPTQTYPASTLRYEVQDDSGTTVCGAASPVATSCAYTAPAGTRSYAVTAVFESWTATSAVSNQVTVAATQTALTTSAGSGQSTELSVPFATPLAATVTDSSGAAVHGVAVTFAAPATGSSGTFANGSRTAISTTDADGVATAPTFTANGTAGTYEVTAAGTGVAGPAVFSLTNEAASGQPALAVAADRLVVASTPVAGPASATAGLGAITVQLRDASGMPVDAGVATSVSLSSDSPGAAVFAATPHGAAITAVTIAPGSSSATFFYGDTRAGTPTITAAVPGLTSATQVETITPAAAQSLTFTTQPPASVPQGETFTVAVRAHDTFGNPTSASLSLDNLADVPGANLNGTPSRTGGADGIATFAGLSINEAGDFSVTATSGTDTATSSPIRVDR